MYEDGLVLIARFLNVYYCSTLPVLPSSRGIISFLMLIFWLRLLSLLTGRLQSFNYLIIAFT